MNSNSGCGLEMFGGDNWPFRWGWSQGHILGPGFVECEPVGGGLNLLEAGDPQDLEPDMAHVGEGALQHVSAMESEKEPEMSIRQGGGC